MKHILAVAATITWTLSSVVFLNACVHRNAGSDKPIHSGTSADVVYSVPTRSVFPLSDEAILQHLQRSFQDGSFLTFQEHIEPNERFGMNESFKIQVLAHSSEWANVIIVPDKKRENGRWLQYVVPLNQNGSISGYIERQGVLQP